NAAPFTDLVVDDSGDTSAAGILLATKPAAALAQMAPDMAGLPEPILQALQGTSYLGQISKVDPNVLKALPALAQGLFGPSIYFSDRLHSLAINGGSGENTFLVLGTPAGDAFTTTTLRTGMGQDIVDVQ